MTTPQYAYRVVAVERVVDGDTYWLRLDVGFRQWQLTPIRLHGWDCPESNRGSERERAEARVARRFAEQWLADHVAAGTSGCAVWCRTERDPDDFGRWLGEVWAEWDPTTPEGEPVRVDLGESLGRVQLASRWPTKWRDRFDGARDA